MNRKIEKRTEKGTEKRTKNEQYIGKCGVLMNVVEHEKSIVWKKQYVALKRHLQDVVDWKTWHVGNNGRSCCM